MKVDTEILQAYISKDLNMKCAALHGSKTQEKREEALNSLRDGKVDIIVCTNVAARGIDIESVAHVINFDAPNTLVDYVHRIGRTGRAGKKGMATTLLQESDSHIFYDLRKYMEEND
jgi:ATP-dependent RNA helicase DDX23/PRP28